MGQCGKSQQKLKQVFGDLPIYTHNMDEPLEIWLEILRIEIVLHIDI